MRQITIFHIFIIFTFLFSSCGKAPSFPSASESFPLSKIWSHQFDSNIYNIATSEEWIAIGSTNRLTAIDTKSGNILWEKDISLDINSALLFSDELLIASDSVNLFVIKKSGEIVKTIMLENLGKTTQILAVYSNYVFIRRLPNWDIEVIDIQNGKVAWKVSTGRGGVSINYDKSANAVIISSPYSISTQSIIDGELIWRLDRYASISTLDSETLFYITKTPEEKYPQTISAIETEQLNVIWSNEDIFPDQESIFNLTVLENLLIASTDFGLITIDKENGKKVWQSEVKEGIYGHPIILNDVLYARGIDTDTVFAISFSDGHQIGYLKLTNNSLFSLSQAEFENVYVSMGILIIPFENSIYAYK